MKTYIVALQLGPFRHKRIGYCEGENRKGYSKIVCD